MVSPSPCRLALEPKTVWRPQEGAGQLGAQHPVKAPLKDGRYEFALPPQIDPGTLQLTVGDATRQSRIEPTLRPELTSVVANVKLPAYLGLPEPVRRDVRGGSISIVKGGEASFTATASRELAAAYVDGRSQPPQGAAVTSPPVTVDGGRSVEFKWEDTFGLAGKEPFKLTIAGRDDEAPSISTEDLARQRVVLDTEQLSFKVRRDRRLRRQADRHRVARGREPGQFGAGTRRAHPRRRWPR